MPTTFEVPHCPLTGSPSTLKVTRLSSIEIVVHAPGYDWPIACDERAHGQLIIIDGRLLEGGLPPNVRVLLTRGLKHLRFDMPAPHVCKPTPGQHDLLERRAKWVKFKPSQYAVLFPDNAEGKFYRIFDPRTLRVMPTTIKSAFTRTAGTPQTNITFTDW